MKRQTGFHSMSSLVQREKRKKKEKERKKEERKKKERKKEEKEERDEKVFLKSSKIFSSIRSI